MRQHLDNSTHKEVVVGGSSHSHGRRTAPLPYDVRENKRRGYTGTQRSKENVSDMHAKRHPGFQYPTKLKTLSPRCPELDRLVTEGGRGFMTEWKREEKESSKPAKDTWHFIRGTGNKNSLSMSYRSQENLG